MWKAPEAIPCHRHHHNMTRLRCSHCETPICPECMIQTEVGFKCPVCIEQQASHLFQVKPSMFLAVFGCSLLFGFGYGYIHPILMRLPIVVLGLPMLGILVAFAIGQLLGRTLKNVLHYKRHPVFFILLTIGYLVGLWLGPFSLFIINDWSLIQQMIANGDGNVLETGASAIYNWLGLLGDFILPFLLYDGLKRTFRD